VDENEKMNITIDLAEKALAEGEMPISACIFHEDRIVAKAHTSEKSDGRLLVHAELKALLEADNLNYNVQERKKLRLFTTLEPCLMCYGAAMSFFLGGIYYSLKAPEDGILSLGLVNFENFSSGYLQFQEPSVSGGYCVERSRALFEKYRDVIEGEYLRSFANRVIEYN
jgi:tRNA(adenine34) deaminase